MPDSSTMGDLCVMGWVYPTYAREVLGEYSKVAHSIMVAAANDHLGTTVFEAPAITDRWVKELREMLCKFAKEPKDLKDPKPKRWDLDVELPKHAQAVRRKLLHISFNDSLGMGLRMGDNGVPERKFIEG